MRKIIYAKLHTNLFIGGIGDFGSVLPPLQMSFRPGERDLETEFTPGEGLSVRVKDHVKRISREAFIPASSVAYVIYDDVVETDKKVTSIKKA